VAVRATQKVRRTDSTLSIIIIKYNILKILCNLLFISGLTRDDPAWVGAWWIPSILSSVLSFILAFFMFLFPKELPGKFYTTASVACFYLSFSFVYS